MNYETSEALQTVGRALLPGISWKASPVGVSATKDGSTVLLGSPEEFSGYVEREIANRPVRLTPDSLHALSGQVFDAMAGVSEHWIADDLHHVGSQLSLMAKQLSR